ncbi:class I SAM-dependent methyltransferase [Fibrobacterota bacterium]
MKRNWLDFWEHEDIFREVNWRRNMSLFVKSSRSVMEYEKTDLVLDIGCGPGYFEEHMHDKVRAICALDTSQRYVNECKERFSRHHNLSFRHLSPDYLDFSILEKRTFNKILCISVVQYYAGREELYRLVKEVKKYALPGAKLLISDIIMKEKGVLPFLNMMASACRNNYLWEQITFLLRARFSDYYNCYSQTGLLRFTQDELNEFIKNVGEKVTLVDKPLTLDHGRKHLLVEY